MLKIKSLFSTCALAFAMMTAPAFIPSAAAQEAKPKITPVTELAITDSVVGTGAEAVAGKTVTVHYTGVLYAYLKPDHRGRQFDSSINREPFTFKLGAGQVIKGWDQGVVGMKVGGKRTLIIPSELGYGARGAGRGTIPPNAALLFDVELLNVQ